MSEADDRVVAWGRITWQTLHRWAADPSSTAAIAARIVQWMKQSYPCARCRTNLAALTQDGRWKVPLDPVSMIWNLHNQVNQHLGKKQQDRAVLCQYLGRPWDRASVVPSVQPWYEALKQALRSTGPIRHPRLHVCTEKTCAVR